jgi:putative secretion ATPase (PEP-CTERM system associated)
MFDDFYGLKGRPFQLTPDPAFYFESLTHRKALSYLGYGLAQGEGFVVITGEVGAGKSTLVAHLMSTIDPARLTAAQVVTSKLDGEELVHVVAQAFGLLIEGHDKATALGAIEGFLHEEARAGRRCLLIVDESQNLSISALEELRMLSNFQLGSHPLLQTLLLGQPEFRETLLEHPQLEQLRQRVIAAHHLDAMESTEVQPYIEHRMKCVGWEGNPAFDQRVFAEIYTASGGVPRRINQIVNRLLLLGAVDQRTRIDGVMLSQVLSELTEDGTLSLMRQPSKAHGNTPLPLRDTQAPVDHAVAERVEPSDIAGIAQVEAALAERDAQIVELQQAVLELANASDVQAQNAAHLPGGSDDRDLHDRIAALEGRLLEQDRTIRHTLTMLIEWIEAGDSQRVAA